MKNTILIAVFLISLFKCSEIFPQEKTDQHPTINKINLNDRYDYIAINQIKMWIGNNGAGSRDPTNGGPGLYWPGGEDAVTTAVFSDGLMWGGYVDDSLRANGSRYGFELQAGRILENGVADDPALQKNRIYKIKKWWVELPPGPTRNKYEKDYNEWPGQDGAPFVDVNSDGKYTAGIDQPEFTGDEVLWCVMNDLDTSRSTFWSERSRPIGLEIQMLVYGFSNINLDDVVFKKYRIINKSPKAIDSMYFTYFSDPDLGDAGDDYVGCDTTLKLAYCYNGDNDDGGGTGRTYGTPPPAIGYLMVQGPIKKASTEDSAFYSGQWIKGYINDKLHSFNIVFYTSVPHHCWPLPWTPQVYYQLIKGKIYEPRCHEYLIDIINPLTGEKTNFMCPGDPVSGTGWYEGEGWPGGPASGDRRMLMSTGPITIAPGDTQEVAIAILIAQGSDNIQSVAELKKFAKIVQYFYDHYTPGPFDIDYEPPKPEYYYLAQNFPNPFNPVTTIRYELPRKERVTLEVYDILGNKIANLVEEDQEAGEYRVEFSSDGLSSGIYFYTINAGMFSRTKKMVVVR